MLSDSQVQHYQENGFLVLQEIIPAEEIQRLKNAALGIVDGFDIEKHRSVFTTTDRDSGRDEYFYQSAEHSHCFLEEAALDEKGVLVKPKHLAINKIGHAMHDLDPDFKHFCSLPVFQDILSKIGYQDPLLWQTMYIFKQPHIGGEVRWHQDGSYLISQPASVMGIWIAMEDAHRDNGCLWVQPGGHRSPLREIFEVDWATGKAQLTELDPTPWPDTGDALAVEVPAGSIVLFHDHMPHFSSQNRSSKSRHAFTMHVAEKQSVWSERNWLQRRSLGDFAL